MEEYQVLIGSDVEIVSSDVSEEEACKIAFERLQLRRFPQSYLLDVYPLKVIGKQERE